MTSHFTVFEFEKDFSGSLYCVPMCVRLKLDCAGVKLSLGQWNRIPLADREWCVSSRCDDDAESLVYRRYVVDALEKATGEVAKSPQKDPLPEWRDATRVPLQLVARLRGLALSELDVAGWSALHPLQRFALLKLGTSGHTNENFLPALREFGLEGTGQSRVGAASAEDSGVPT